MYDLPDLAWQDPTCVFRGRLSKSQFSAKNSGQQMTQKLAVPKGTRSSTNQVDIGVESSTALPTVVSVGLPASSGGASLVALMVQSMPRQLPTSTLAYEESFTENEEALAKTNLPQLELDQLTACILRRELVFELVHLNQYASNFHSEN